MPSSHLILCCPLLLLLPIPPSIKVFSNESTLRMRWPKYWSFSFSISPSNEHPGLIFFRVDWLDLKTREETQNNKHKKMKKNFFNIEHCSWTVRLLRSPTEYYSSPVKLFPDCCLWLKEKQNPLHTLFSLLNGLTGPSHFLITCSFRKWEWSQESHFFFVCLKFFTWELEKDLRKKYLHNTSEELWGQ